MDVLARDLNRLWQRRENQLQTVATAGTPMLSTHNMLRGHEVSDLGHSLCFGWRSHTRTLALLTGLGEKRTEDLHDLGGTALGTLGPLLPVLRDCLHAGESFTALLAAILISRHSADTSTSDFVHQGPYAASPARNHHAQAACILLPQQEEACESGVTVESLAAIVASQVVTGREPAAIRQLQLPQHQ